MGYAETLKDLKTLKLVPLNWNWGKKWAWAKLRAAFITEGILHPLQVALEFWVNKFSDLGGVPERHDWYVIWREKEWEMTSRTQRERLLQKNKMINNLRMFIQYYYWEKATDWGKQTIWLLKLLSVVEQGPFIRPYSTAIKDYTLVTNYLRAHMQNVWFLPQKYQFYPLFSFIFISLSRSSKRQSVKDLYIFLLYVSPTAMLCIKITYLMNDPSSST